LLTDVWTAQGRLAINNDKVEVEHSSSDYSHFANRYSGHRYGYLYGFLG